MTNPRTRVAPVWVRGLKPASASIRSLPGAVAPVWVRGLKLDGLDKNLVGLGRTRMGAWIETYTSSKSSLRHRSHPYGCVD